ncbi:MAG: methyltransferase FkbM family [Gammaproteobacteria bacterium]|jgi:FkbM family methyltransferase|nr:methyltransferase FkbM family [Gammaproteobacteria bacterium]
MFKSWLKKSPLLVYIVREIRGFKGKLLANLYVLISMFNKHYRNDAYAREYKKIEIAYGYHGIMGDWKIPVFNYHFRTSWIPMLKVQFREIFRDRAYAFSSKHAKPVILDIGANIGLSVLYFKMNYPNACIKAYEADPKVFEMLQYNIESNQLKKNVELFQQAVWVDNSGLEFCQNGNDAGGIYGAGQVIKVSSIRLRDILEQEPYISLLKIDIEGAEVEVLKDCQDRLSHVENLFVEYHSWPNKAQHLDEILRIIKKSGFHYYIEGITKRLSPFIDQLGGQPMDLQLNIYAYRQNGTH